MIRPFAAVCVLLVLAACGQSSDQPKQTAVPASAPAAPQAVVAAGPFEGDLNALGTEPFWAIEIRPAGLKLSRPGVADVTTANSGPEIKGSNAVWTEDGLVLTLTQATCSDGMSDRSYPYTAEATVTGVTMKGCATRVGAAAATP